MAFDRVAKLMFACIASTASIAVAGCSAMTVDAPIDCPNCAAWNEPQPPFRIFGNTYYVGVAGLSSILIDTGDRLVLIDGGLPQTAPLIAENIRALGFRTGNVVRILVSHVHFDHVGGVSALQRLTGATVQTSAAGLESLQGGSLDRLDPQYSEEPALNRFPAADSVLAVSDGEQLRIGAVEITAIATPGHSRGGMSWSWRSCEDARCLDLVYADSLSPVAADGFRFVDDPAGTELRASAAKIAALRCDILLSPHPFYFDMKRKLEASRNGDAIAFVDNTACRRYAESSLRWLERRLESEREARAAGQSG